MFEFLSWLESSPLGQFLRSSGIWTYGLPNLGPILGISTLFGAVLLLDLRLLGAWRRIRRRRDTAPNAHLLTI